MMIGFLALAFAGGGLFGLVGMALLAYGPKTNLMRENDMLRNRLEFMEDEYEKRHVRHVRDPRPHVHKLVN